MSKRKDVRSTDNGCGFTTQGRLAIGLMMTAGLRRNETVSLRFEDIKKQHVCTMLDPEDKGAKNRVVLIRNKEPVIQPNPDAWRLDRQAEPALAHLC